MPTHDEEIRTKFSFDTSVLGKAKQDIKDFAETGESGFVHMGSKGRAFHRVMEQITEQSPVMGNALRLVLNPMIGGFALLAAGISGAHAVLEKFNARWDQMRNDAAKPIGTPGETLFGLIDQSRKTVASAKQKLEPFAAKDTQGLQSRDRATIDADIKATQDRINGLLKHQTALKTEQQTVDHLKEEIKKLEEKRGELNDQQVGDEAASAAARKGGLFGGIKASVYGFQELLAGRTPGTAKSQLDRLYSLRAQLARAGNSKFGTGGAADEEQTASQLKEQQDRLAGLQIEQGRAPLPRLDLRRAPFRRGQIPNPASGPGLGIPFGIQSFQSLLHPFRAIQSKFGGAGRPAPTIDPLTGGYSAQGIADSGGIEYKPIQGAPGFVPPVKPETDMRTNQQRVDDILQTLLSHLKSGGVPVKGSE